MNRRANDRCMRHRSGSDRPSKSRCTEIPDPTCPSQKDYCMMVVNIQDVIRKHTIRYVGFRGPQAGRLSRYLNLVADRSGRYPGPISRLRPRPALSRPSATTSRRSGPSRPKRRHHRPYYLNRGHPPSTCTTLIPHPSTQLLVRKMSSDGMKKLNILMCTSLQLHLP